MSEQQNTEGHEPLQMKARGVVAFGLGLLVFLGLIFWGLTGLRGWLEQPGADLPPPFDAVERVVEGPALQQDPATDLYALHARQAERLKSYGWIDREAGRVHIPIDRAMTLLAARDTTAAAPPETTRVLTESGYALRILEPAEPGPPAYLGSSPERYVPAPEIGLDLPADTAAPLPPLPDD